MAMDVKTILRLDITGVLYQQQWGNDWSNNNNGLAEQSTELKRAQGK
jgi:hypothetical protein